MARRPVPADLEDELASSPAARARFWSLPPEELDRWVAYVQRARFPGQRRRRIAETVRRLGGTTAAVETREREGAGGVGVPREARGGGGVGFPAPPGAAGFPLWVGGY